LLIPQGWKQEYNGWDPRAAWARTLETGARRRSARFESGVGLRSLSHRPRRAGRNHLRVVHDPDGALRRHFRVRLGHMVVCNGFRNPPSSRNSHPRWTWPRADGSNSEWVPAGRKDEWLAYGYGFPPRPSGSEPCMTLGGDHSDARTGPGHVPRAIRRVADAVNVPRVFRSPARDHRRRQRPAGHVASGRSLRRRTQPGICLNDQVAAWLPTIRARCEEIGRDPANAQGFALRRRRSRAGSGSGARRLYRPVRGGRTQPARGLSHAAGVPPQSQARFAEIAGLRAPRWSIAVR